jgi:hypothetical protein
MIQKKYLIIIIAVVVSLVFLLWFFLSSQDNYKNIIEGLKTEISQLRQEKENLNIVQQIVNENNLTKEDVDLSSALLTKLFSPGMNIGFKEPIRIITHDSNMTPVPHTLEAMQEAVNLGVYGIEDDVQFTKDRVAVLLDNPEVNGKKISEITSAELKNYKINGKYKIPELGEAIDFLKGKVKLFIADLTGVPYLPEGMSVSDIPLAVQKIISEHQAEDFVVMQTANPDFLKLIDFDKYLVAWNTFDVQHSYRNKIDFYTLNPAWYVTYEKRKEIYEAGAEIIPVNVTYAVPE